MPARTLAQAIDRLADLRPEVSPHLLSTVDDILEARRHLDGLEESRAIVDVNAHAYEHATRLAKAAGGSTWTATADRILSVAHFLAPTWHELEAPDGVDVMRWGQETPVARIPRDGLEDDLGPLASRDELAATEAGATARADDLENMLERKEAELYDLRNELAASIERNDPIVRIAAARAEEIDELRADKDRALDLIRQHVETIAELRAEDRVLRTVVDELTNNVLERNRIIDIYQRTTEAIGNAIAGGADIPAITAILEELNA